MHRDDNLTPSEALSRLRETRPLCEPNDGFLQQLELYHLMKCPENVDIEPAYQRWLYKREVEMSVACGLAPDRIKFQDEEARNGDEKADVELRCRKCRYAHVYTPSTTVHLPYKYI